MGLVEPIIEASNISQWFLTALGMDLLVFNIAELPSLWFMVSKILRATVIMVSRQHITYFNDLGNGMHVVFVIYDATTVFDLRELWEELRQVAAMVSEL